MADQGAPTDNLKSDLRDHLVAAARGLSGAVPFAGGVLGELIAAVIPNQRADRIAAYLTALAHRLDALEADMQAKIRQDPARIDLIEQGGYQAARALSPERIERIVEAVTRGLTSDDADVIRRKRLLTLFGELDDDEVVLLNAYGRSYGGQDPDAWDAVNRPDPAHIGASRSVLDRNALYDAGKDHLMRLGLIEKRFPGLRRGHVPEFDSQRGDFKHSVSVSPLGRMLLREIGLAAPVDGQGDDVDLDEV